MRKTFFWGGTLLRSGFGLRKIGGKSGQLPNKNFYAQQQQHNQKYQQTQVLRFLLTSVEESGGGDETFGGRFPAPPVDRILMRESQTNLHTGCLGKIVKNGEHKPPPEHTFMWHPQNPSPC